MAGDTDIQRVFNVITVQMGAQVMLAAKIRLREHLDVGQASAAINRLEARLQSQFPEIAWCFIEPDVED